MNKELEKIIEKIEEKYGDTDEIIQYKIHHIRELNQYLERLINDLKLLAD